MTSVDELLDAIAEDFRTIAGGRTHEEFVANTTKWLYATTFSERFASFAPDAWQSLLGLGPISDACVGAFFAHQSHLHHKALQDLRNAVLAWSQRYNLATPGQWVAAVA